MPAGTHPITAVYGGDAVYLGSTSAPPYDQVVNKAATTTNLASSLNPSIFGDSVTFTATVSPAAATGTVEFFDGATSLGTGTLSGGVATYTTSSLTVGTHPVTATYSGDPNFLASTSAPLDQVVEPGRHLDDLASSLNPSPFGTSVTFTATVAVLSGVGSPSGSVQFFDGATAILAIPLAGTSATFSTALLGPGSHAITAVYSGDASFAGSTSAVLTQVVDPIPLAPSSLVATAVSSTQINLTWTDNATNETGFTIQRATNSAFTGGSLTTITLNGANRTSYNNTGRAPSTTYYYRVRAFNANGFSAWSNIASAFTAVAGSPAAPSSLIATAVSPNQINLAWTDNANNETGFTIQRATNPNFTGTSTITLNGANQTSYNNTGRAANTTYYYRVRAFNASGPSAWSNTASATTPPAIGAVPTGLTVTPPAAPAGRTSLVISWTYTSNGAPGPIMFDVQRSNTGAGGWTTVANNISPTTFTNTGLPVNTTRYYRVRTVTAAGNSAWTPVVSGRTLP